MCFLSVIVKELQTKTMEEILKKIKTLQETIQNKEGFSYESEKSRRTKLLYLQMCFKFVIALGDNL